MNAESIRSAYGKKMITLNMNYSPVIMTGMSNQKQPDGKSTTSIALSR